ncbi:MAG: FHA domain-containing protein [Nitrospirota bacterium]
MKVVCPNCHSVYLVKDENVPPSGAKAKCPKCEFLISLLREPSSDMLGRDVDYGKTMVLFMQHPAQQEQQQKDVESRLSDDVLKMPEGMKALLKVVEGDEPGREYALVKPRTIIGRSNANIQLTDPEVSRRHAEIAIYGDRAVVKDLGSTNGTFLNSLGVRLSYIKDGDELQVGNTVFKFMFS